MADERFWERKPLSALSEEEWESLCDGCGRCCLVVLEDEDEGAFYETSVACQLFDPVARRCSAYEDRHRIVPGCVKLDAQNTKTLDWMPGSCAYRRLAEGRGLAPWHPLLTGRRESVVEAGIAVDEDLTNEQQVKLKQLWRYVTGRR